MTTPPIATPPGPSPWLPLALSLGGSLVIVTVAFATVTADVRALERRQSVTEAEVKELRSAQASTSAGQSAMAAELRGLGQRLEGRLDDLRSLIQGERSTRR